jgi:hypothetical protein
MRKYEILKELQEVMCSNGNCIFRILPEQKIGMHTNGRCHCLDNIEASERRAIRAIFAEIARHYEEVINDQASKI